MIALKTARWIWLQRAVSIPGGFGRSFLAYLTGMYAGLITPGRIGELVRVRYLTDAGAPLGAALSTVLLDRVIDILGLLGLGLLAMAPLAGEFFPLYVSVVAVSAGSVLAALTLLRREGSGYRMLRGGLRRLFAATGSAGMRAESLAVALRDAASALTPAMIAGMTALTLLGWFIYYLQAFALARALGIPLGLSPLIVSTTTAAVAALVPVSISGLGTRDAVLVVLFGKFGRPSEEAVAFSSLVFLMLVANAFFGLIASQRLGPSPARDRVTSQDASPLS